MAETKKVYYGNQPALEVPAETSLEQIRIAYSAIFPEVANASVDVATNGDVTFKVTAGTKGAGEIKKVYYGNQPALEVPVETSLDQIRTAYSAIFPEVANASVEVAPNGDVTFKVTAGTKGN